MDNALNDIEQKKVEQISTSFPGHFEKLERFHLHFQLHLLALKHNRFLRAKALAVENHIYWYQ